MELSSSALCVLTAFPKQHFEAPPPSSLSPAPKRLGCYKSSSWKDCAGSVSRRSSALSLGARMWLRRVGLDGLRVRVEGARERGF